MMRPRVRRTGAGAASGRFERLWFKTPVPRDASNGDR